MILLNNVLLSILLLINKYTIINAYDSSLQESLQDEFDAESIYLGSVDLSDYKNEKLQVLTGTSSSSSKNVTLINYLGEENFTTYNYDGDHLIYYNYNDNVDLPNGTATTYINILTGQSSANITKMTSLQPFDNNSFVITGTGELNSKDLSKQVLLNLTDLSYTELFNESITTVNDVLFNVDTIYFGGDFQFNDDYNAVISYNFSTNSVEALPFGGFGDGALVNTISKLETGILLFAGKFDTLDKKEYLTKTVYYEYQNVTVTNETVTSNESISTNSTNQVQQLVSLKYATWDNNDDSSFTSIDDFMCPSDGSTNWVGDSSTSNFEVTFLNNITPSKVRLFMSTDSDYVSEFRLMMLNGGFLNVTYYDPFDNVLKSCDTYCNLYNNITGSGTIYLQDNITSLSYNKYYQDFYFSPNVPLDGLEFQALVGEKMSGLQLFQSEFFVYANDTLNDPGCSDVTSHSYSSINPSNWSAGVTGSYIYTSVESSDERSSAYVKFMPQINVIGEYTLNFYTPGCTADGTCSARGIVNVTTTYTESDGTTKSQSSLIYQDNDYEKYDTIFSGYLYSQPTIEMKYYEPITVGNTDSLIMVADRIGVDPVSIPDPVNYVTTKNTTTTTTTNTTVILSKNESLVINGLFEYSISNFTNSSLNSSMVVGNTSLNTYTSLNFIDNGITNFTLFATFYNHTLIIASSTFDGIVLLTMDEDSDGITYQNKLSTGGTAKNAYTLENGLQLLIGSFILDNQNLSTLYYDQSDGTFASLGAQMPNDLSGDNFNSVYDNYGALIFSFDNQVYYNWTLQQSFSNSSDFHLIMKSAGFNINGDTLLFGSIYNSKYSDVISGSSFTIDSDFQMASLSLPNQDNSDTSSSSSFHYYDGVYINETYTGYAIEVPNNTYSMIFVSSNGSSPLLAPYSFTSKMENLLYYNGNGLLSFTSDSSLYLYNLTEIATIADESLGNVTSSEVNSMLYFSSDDSMLLCGTFDVLYNSSCNGTCLYDVKDKKFVPLLLGSKDYMITGEVNKCVLAEEDLLYVAGNFSYAKDDYNLFAVNMTTGKVSSKYEFDFEIGTVSDFQMDEDNDVIYVTTLDNPEMIFYQYFNSSDWYNISLPTTNSTIESYIPLTGVTSDSKKRDLGSTKILALTNEGESMVYESGIWKPFFQLSTEDSSDEVGASLFSNKDMTSSMVSEKVSPLAALIEKVVPPKKRTKTGYVVLFGLAMSTVTVTLLVVIISSILYYLGMKTRKAETSYKMDKLFEDTLESKMVRNVPPEELMKGLS